MNTVPCTNRFPVVAGNSSRGPGGYDSACSVSTIGITQEDTGEMGSPAEMRKPLNRKIGEQYRKCAICREEFTDYSVLDHRDPKGMGGAWRDDHSDNIQATRWWCNGEKGSTRMDD